MTATLTQPEAVILADATRNGGFPPLMLDPIDFAAMYQKRLQQAFFEGDKKVSAEIVFISSTDERDRMRNKGIVKVSLRDPAGCSLVITAPADRIQKA